MAWARNPGRSKAPDVNALVKMTESLVNKINHAHSTLPPACAQMPVLHGERVIYSLACSHLHNDDGDDRHVLRSSLRNVLVNVFPTAISKRKGEIESLFADLRKSTPWCNPLMLRSECGISTWFHVSYNTCAELVFILLFYCCVPCSERKFSEETLGILAY